MIEKKIIYVCEKCGRLGECHFFEHRSLKGKFCRGTVIDRKLVFVDDLLKELPVCDIGKNSQHNCCLAIKKLRKELMK